MLPSVVEEVVHFDRNEGLKRAHFDRCCGLNEWLLLREPAFCVA